MEKSNGVLLLNRKQVEDLLDLDELVDVMANALAGLSAGTATAPNRIAAESPAPGYLAVMPAYLPGIFSTKLVSVFAGNHALGLPSHQALIALFDAGNGSPTALLDGTAITAARTAAVSALSVRLLAREDARILAIVGTGVQARSHLRAVARLREFTEIRVAGIAPAEAAAMVRDCAGFLTGTRSARAELRSATDARAAVEGADVVCACTDAHTPVIARSWLKPGAHVTSVGFPGPELDRDSVGAGLLAVESRAAFAPYPAGAGELQGRDPQAAAELGEIVAGTRRGRSSASEITVLKSVGHAVEDGAAARMVVERARRAGLGTRFSFD